MTMSIPSSAVTLEPVLGREELEDSVCRRELLPDRLKSLAPDCVHAVPWRAPELDVEGCAYHALFSLASAKDRTVAACASSIFTSSLLVYESCYGIGMNLLLEERGKRRGHEACVPCFVLFHATFLEVEGDSLISF